MKYLCLFIILILPYQIHAQTVPQWCVNIFNGSGLSKSYQLVAFLKPGYLKADINGDGQKDIVATIVQKKTNKKGFVVFFAGSKTPSVFGAGKPLGKAANNYGDDIKWADSWSIYKDKVANETIFDSSGDIKGSARRKLKNKSISIWQSMDGSPLAGFILTWDKKWIWIHQGE